MNDTDLKAGTRTDAVHRFFDEFDAAFVTFDGDVIARRYAEPYLACRADGSSETFHSCAAIGRYFDHIVKGYYQIGVRSCTHRDVEITDVGERHTLATVTWELRDDAGATVITWRESYLLVDEADKLCVRTSIDFPGTVT